MRKLLKYLIIFLILIISIILILLLKLNENIDAENNNINNINNINNNIINEALNYTNVNSNNITAQYIKDNSKKFEIVKSRKDYLEVEDAVLNLISDIKVCNSDSSIKAIYKVEGQQLVEQKRQELKDNLNMQISDKCDLNKFFSSEVYVKIISKETYTINKIYFKKMSSNITVYMVYGRFIKSDTEYKLMLVYDTKTEAYEIYLDNYINSNYDITDINNINISVNNIAKNKYNALEKYTEEEADKKIVQRYFLTTKTQLIDDPKKIYNTLYQGYRKKFNNIDEFYEFAPKIHLSKIKEYKIEDKETYSDIICKDDIGNCIIFRETRAMNYTILLDPYTFEIDTLKSEYNTTEKNKIILNVQIFGQMINMKDYNELYKRLNGVFYSNNFGSIQKLKEYMNNNFYERTKFVYISSEKKNDEYYVVKVQIINNENKDERKFINIVMKLGETTDFEISFSFEE